MHNELLLRARPPRAPQRHPGIRAVATDDVVDHVQIAQLGHVVVVDAGYSAQRFHSSFFWSRALTHLIDKSLGACDLDFFPSIPRRARRTYVLVGVTTRSDNRRVAHP